MTEGQADILIAQSLYANDRMVELYAAKKVSNGIDFIEVLILLAVLFFMIIAALRRSG